MAHFAEIDPNTNLVLRVLVVHDSEEHRGQQFLADDLLLGGKWVQTSYNGKIRKNYAGVGFTYDQTRDAFIPPKPFPSWILDEETCKWKSKIQYPNDGNVYAWNEDSKEWVLFKK